MKKMRETEEEEKVQEEKEHQWKQKKVGKE
jgi:hypothetical protein